MFGFPIHPARLVAVAVALTVIGAPLAARAQDLPSYAQPAYVSTDETIHGRIRSVDGAFNISVDDDRGFIDNVELHQGTIINPTGLTLSPGMSVTILGSNNGPTFGANEIDTPYSYSGPLPTPVYLGPGYWCPGFAYGYGPSFSLAIVIGGGYGGGYSYVHRPFYGRPWNGHAYFGGHAGRVPVNTARIDENHELNHGAAEPARAPSAFPGRSFAGETRAPGSDYAHSVPGGYAPRNAPGGYGAHDTSGGYGARDTSGGYGAHNTSGGYGARSAPGGYASHGAPGGYARGGSAGRSAPASHGGGGHPH